MSTASPRRDFRGLVLPVAFIALWATATRFGWVNTKLIVPPQNVLQVAWQTVSQGGFFAALAASLFRDLSGLAIGSVAGIAFGALLGLSRLAERAIGPTFHTLKQISLFAWLPLLASWLGSGDPAKIVFVALSAFYPVALGAFEGVRSVSRAQLEVARVHTFTRWQTLTRLVLPAAAPQIITGLQLGLVSAWLATIGAEFLLARGGVGLGDIVIKGRAAFQVELIVFGMLAIGAVGALFNRAATVLEARALRWRGPAA
jgi:sulfonate transport system permease protein